MKRLYARFVLWLIRPALDERERLARDVAERDMAQHLENLKG